MFVKSCRSFWVPTCILLKKTGFSRKTDIRIAKITGFLDFGALVHPSLKNKFPFLFAFCLCLNSSSKSVKICPLMYLLFTHLKTQIFLRCNRQTWVGFGFSNPKSKIQIQNPGFWSGFKILFSGWILDLDLNPFFGQGFPNPFLNPFCRGKYYFTIFVPSFSILSIYVCFSRVSNMKQTCILHFIWS